MGATDILLFALWIASVFPTGLSCPKLCVCSNKSGRHVAECPYKDLTQVPNGFPPNITTLSLPANKIKFITLGSFSNVTRMTSLWLAHNEILSIEHGAITPLIHLRNLDVSHNKITDFPWEDLQNLTVLHLLKMNHNELVNLPRDAFFNLKSLKSILLNNNRIATIVEGTFDSLLSLSHLQIYNNPFACTCSLEWLRDWISTTIVSIPSKDLVLCASPEKLKDEEVQNLPDSGCSRPNVTIHTDPSIEDMNLDEDSELVLNCEFKGNPHPLVMWSIHSKRKNQDLALLFTKDDSAWSNQDSLTSNNAVKVFNNGTLIISNLKKEDSGEYICSATNELGRAEDSVTVKVAALLEPTLIGITTTPTYMQSNPTRRQTTDKPSVFDLLRQPDLTTSPSTADHSFNSEEASGNLPSSSKCGLTANTRYISNHVMNGTLDDVKYYTFDFGVIALGVSETEATVRLNPLLLPKDRESNLEAKSFQADSKESPELSDFSEKVHFNGLYLCVTADQKHSAVQWSRIKEGVNTYLFSGLQPATNYSLCLTYRGEDCEVQVLFTTRKEIPNLIIIISVSICLLTVSTVPLLAATCFHLVYKYRSKTYKLILKAKDQYHMERSLATSFNLHPPHTESQRKINGSQLDEEEGMEAESLDGEKERDTEESVIESFSLSQCRANLDDFEVASEYSDRLPLGAEAVNITDN